MLPSSLRTGERPRRFLCCCSAAPSCARSLSLNLGLLLCYAETEKKGIVVGRWTRPDQSQKRRGRCVVLHCRPKATALSSSHGLVGRRHGTVARMEKPAADDGHACKVQLDDILVAYSRDTSGFSTSRNLRRDASQTKGLLSVIQLGHNAMGLNDKFNTPLELGHKMGFFNIRPVSRSGIPPSLVGPLPGARVLTKRIRAPTRAATHASSKP